jgi:hypothetical protein
MSAGAATMVKAVTTAAIRDFFTSGALPLRSTAGA